MRKFYFIAILLVAISYLHAATTQTITFSSLPVKGYGDVTFNLTATSSSGLPVTYVSSNTTVATISGSTVTIKAAGYSFISAMQAGNTTYAAATPVAQPLIVCAKGTLTVTANNQSLKYGTTVASPTNTITGFKTGENASVITGAPVYSALTSLLPNGVYPITINKGTMTALNYDFEMVDGTLTINSAPTIATTVSNDELNVKVYPNPTSSYLYVENVKDAKIVLLNLLGKEVLIQKSIDRILKLDVSEFPNGLYILNIYNGNDVVSHKVKIVNK